MYKYSIFYILLMLITINAGASEGDEKLNLAGAGVFVATSPYAGVSTKTMPIPFLVGEYKGFYIKGIEAGYHWFEQGPWTLSAATSPHLMGYSSDDSVTLNGMENRQMSLDAGVRAVYALPADMGQISAKVLVDVLSRNKGASAELLYGKEFKGNIFRFYPSLGLKYLDKSLVDYYFGVRDQEARLGRDAYGPQGAIDPFVDFIFSCGISKQWIIITKFDVESLGRSIRKSPIVDENYVVSASAGLTYRF
ncbi:MAG: MipA/OmpV family protein [Candidatus Omnitrophota bacterium]